MGIVTRQVRRATVATLEASNVLVIKRTAFESVLSADKAAEARIYRNIVDILADKIVQDNVRTRDYIVQDNVRTRDYLVEKVRQEERIREARRRADLALELVVSEAGMDRTRAQAIIDDHIDNEPRLRVLIVDDEAEMRRMLCDALADYDTSEARDGEEALEEIGDDPPDLVITDIRMPGMDGYELVRKLKERSPETPVLAISGYVSDADIVDYEFDAFLEKPMNLKEFRDFVDVALAEEE
jgi:CheY-like chemotaxis protein